MAQRRSLRLPITLGVVLIILTVALAVGWILLTVFGAANGSSRVLYWTLLSIGTAGFVVVLTGVSIYLGLSVKTINLTKRQSNFIDSVTHELKSPIASLKLYLQTLTSRDVDERHRREFYRLMLDDVQRLDELIDHVLLAARLDRTEGSASVELVDMRQLMANCAQTVCQRHGIARSAIRMELTSFYVQGRTVDLEIIFRNLLDNAIKYGGEHPAVHVSNHFVYPGEVTIYVQDNGPGIPRAERRRIFRRFVRLGVELERKKPGLGLGLYLVRTLVRRLQGSVQVHPRDDRGGTVFEVRLPARATRDPSNSPERTSGPAETAQDNQPRQFDQEKVGAHAQTYPSR